MLVYFYSNFLLFAVDISWLLSFDATSTDIHFTMRKATIIVTMQARTIPSEHMNRVTVGKDEDPIKWWVRKYEGEYLPPLA